MATKTAPVWEPIKIPATTPLRYVSFFHALNLRMPEEDTGDWHFESAFFTERPDERTPAPLAGQGCETDTTPMLGDRGVRDMGAVLVRQGLLTAAEQEACGPVWVADHYRAITDLAMLQLAKGKTPRIATPREINAWLDTEEQIETLRRDYLAPMGAGLEGYVREVFEAWFAKVVFD